MTEGTSVNVTVLNTGEIVNYIQRPPILGRRANVYGLYVQGDSMSPRYESGETIFVDGSQPPRVGDDVVVYVVDGDTEIDSYAVLVKRLVRRTEKYVELEQFTPRKTLKIPRENVSKVHRVIPLGELVQ